MTRSRVCILTSGKAVRLGPYSQFINKALLPVDRKAAISHIIARFPQDTEFVIALGYLGDQVRHFLEMAHPDTRFIFVRVDKYEGPGAGPGYSLLCCREHLEQPFVFVACDTLWGNSISFTEGMNWVGVAAVAEEESTQYCNFEVVDGRVMAVRDKEKVSPEKHRAFVGLASIQTPDLFWDGLTDGALIAGEHQVSNGISQIARDGVLETRSVDWTDLGDLDKYRKAIARYENFDFSKADEFLYVYPQRVIKLFADEGVAARRVEKARQNPLVFPRIEQSAPQLYSYAYTPGRTLYEANSPRLFKRLLDWLDDKLWKRVDVSPNKMAALCRQFYWDKTWTRVHKFWAKYETQDAPTVVLGEELPSTTSLLEALPWERLYEGAPVFFHGDLQFDNILFDSNADRFWLLDWRQDFAGEIAFGDHYYDLAKLYGGIVLNYDYIKSNLLTYKEMDGDITFDFAQRYLSSGYARILEEYVAAKGMDVAKVRQLVGLIYLNMAPLHHSPFDRLLYSLGRRTLYQEATRANR